jgi:hypothetical protein
MVKRLPFKSIAVASGWILLGLLLGLSLQLIFSWLPGLFAPAQPVAAAQSPASAQPGAATAAYECVSIDVGVYVERIHVRCSVAAPGGISFFALSTANTAHAARVLSLIETAHVTGKHLYITYDPSDLSGAAIGCGNSDCRLIQFLSLLP